MSNLSFFDIFYPTRECCPQCKYFRVVHIYGHNTCTREVLSTIFSPNGTVCSYFEQVPDQDLEKTELLWITFKSWYMLYGRNEYYPSGYSEAYWKWLKSAAGQDYVKEYYRRKAKKPMNYSCTTA